MYYSKSEVDRIVRSLCDVFHAEADLILATLADNSRADDLRKCAGRLAGSFACVESIVPEPVDPRPMELAKAILNGEKLTAIKLLRDLYGLSLQEAKNALEGKKA